MIDLVLQVDRISKKFSRGLRGALWYGAQDIAGEVAWWRRRSEARLRDGEFWALQDVTFELRAGESLGVIGGNGAGKSTLLKLLTGLMKPDAGRIRVRGRVRAMIELGAAFNPLLSGRENIFAQGSLYGYSHRDLARHLDAIVEFAAIGAFIDSPVQHYSNGMRARLGFAIAAQLNPDVLLVDEVLAVGDIGFQNKCLQHMRNYLVQGGALVFVGHASHQVQSVCQRGLVLTKGECTFSGDVVDALDVYLKQQRSAGEGERRANGATPPPSDAMVPLSEDRMVRIDALSIAASNGEGITSGGSVRLTVRYSSFKLIPDVSFSFAIFTQDGHSCVGGGLPSGRVTLQEGTHELRCVVPRLPLFGGTYLLRANLFDETLESPLAISGWADAPQRFAVHADTTSKNNLRSLMGMHVGFDAEWE